MARPVRFKGYVGCPKREVGPGLGNPRVRVWGDWWRAPPSKHSERARGSGHAINFAFRAASSACSHAAGSVSATPRATTSWPSLMTSQYQRPSLPLGIMRSSTFSISVGSFGPKLIIQGELEHYLPCRTQSTRRHGAPARGPEEKYRPLYPSSRRTACRPGLDHATILAVEPKPLITLPLTPTLKTYRWAGRFHILSQMRRGADRPTPRAGAGCPRSLAHLAAG